MIVSGGANPRGIGRAILALFLEHGARVACLDLNDVEVGTLEFERIVSVRCDVRLVDACRGAIGQAVQALGGIDVLVNNAGIVGATPITELEEEEFVRMIDVNLNGAYRLTKAALPTLLQAEQPCVVNIGSMAAMRGGGLLGGSHYAASKGGLLSFTKGLARELGPRGLRANAVAPGIIETDMVIGKFEPEVEASLRQGVPLRRFGSAHEVAKVALFLASPLSSYCTGSVIDVNGGFHIH